MTIQEMTDRIKKRMSQERQAALIEHNAELRGERWGHIAGLREALSMLEKVKNDLQG